MANFIIPLITETNAVTAGNLRKRSCNNDSLINSKRKHNTSAKQQKKQIVFSEDDVLKQILLLVLWATINPLTHN